MKHCKILKSHIIIYFFLTDFVEENRTGKAISAHCSKYYAEMMPKVVMKNHI
jgi:hypothetical protein